MKHKNSQGFVLTELLVAGLLTTFLLLGIIQMAAASSRALSLVEGITQTQQGGRFAMDQIRNRAMGAGFSPAPWMAENPNTDYYGASTDGGSGGSDRLVLRDLSERNCYDNPNPVKDDHGHPAYYLRESIFEVSGTGQLALSCRYGPGEDDLVRQINRQGLVRNVDSLQILFAEDLDGDQLANHWVRAGEWESPGNILGIQLGLMVASVSYISDSKNRTEKILDEVIPVPPDGRLRTTWTTQIPFSSRLR